MKAKGLRDVLETRPFHPFTIHLGDGRKLAVERPEFLATSPAGDIVIVLRPDGGFNVVDVDLVTDLDVRPRTERAAAGA